MRHLLTLAAMAATILGTADLAAAKDRPDGPPPECRQSERKCPPPPGKPERDGKRDERRHPPEDQARRGDGQHDGRRLPPPDQARHRRDDDSPRIGDSARNGRVFRPSRDSQLAPAPRGQEYRVLGDRIVRVSSRTGRILEVVGTVR